jgi:predicted kinase
VPLWMPFKRAADRLKALAIGEEAKVPVIFIECVLTEEEAVRRLNARADSPGTEVSDATVEVYEQQRREFEAIREIPARYHLVIDTAGEQEPVASEIDAALERLCQER